LNSYLFDVKTKRRDKLSIIAEILEIAKNGTLKTQIMYRANLSFAQL
jgi:predicted transcriptional regulator